MRLAAAFPVLTLAVATVGGLWRVGSSATAEVRIDPDDLAC
jgi:hypothetical protein